MTVAETESEQLPQEVLNGGRLPVAVLGATGSVGQRFVQLLEEHPWFRISELVASERSAGRNYADAAPWRLSTRLPEEAAGLVVKELGSELSSRIVFSALDSSVAGSAEDSYADRGHAVISNAKNHRMDPDVPLLIPEINADHLDAIERQRKRRGGPGYIVTNPNCSTIGLALAIAPIERQHGIEAMHVATMQAISGAGYAGVSAWDISDNAVPHIGGEEDKIESEPPRILGLWEESGFRDAPIRISAQANRVPVLDGHTLCISFRYRRSENLRRSFPIDVLIEDAKEAIRSFEGEPQRLSLPSAPPRPVVLTEEPDRPQPRLDRDAGNGMVVTIGRLRSCPVLDVRMVALVHNTIRGAAGAAILNAELIHAKGLLPGR